MAKFINLKESIRQVIKPNGNHEITGNILQGILISMVNIVGDGFVLKGEAKPDMTPPQADNNIFYIAMTEGVYPDFGNLTVDKNEIAVFTWDGSWEKLTINGCSLEAVKEERERAMQAEAQLQSTKQNVIADLDTIRSGASKGATAIQRKALYYDSSDNKIKDEEWNVLTYQQVYDFVSNPIFFVTLEYDLIYLLPNVNDGGAVLFIGFTILSDGRYGVRVGINYQNNVKAEIYPIQDKIEDLETIRNGAQLGSTALQPNVADETYAKKEDLERKANIDGAYASMAVGSLLPSGSAIEQTYLSQRTAGGASVAGLARVEKIEGNSAVWNQLITNSNFANGTTDWNGGYQSIQDTEDGYYSLHTLCHDNIWLVKSHKYIIIVTARMFDETFGTRTIFDIRTNGGFGNVQIIGYGQIDTTTTKTYNALFTFEGETALYRCLWGSGCVLIKGKGAILVDLTQMFGAGNEPTTYEEFLSRKPKVADEYAYNAGEVVNMTAEAIKSTSTDGKENLLPLPIANYFPNGMASVGSVADELTATQATRRFGVKVFNGTENLSYNSIYNCFYTSMPAGVKSAYAAISNYYNFVGHYSRLGEKTFSYIFSDNIAIRDSQFNNDEVAFKAHLADLYAQGDPLVVFYELADPIVTPIEPPLQLLYQAYEGGTEEVVAEQTTAMPNKTNYSLDIVATLKKLIQQAITHGWTL